MIRKSRLVIATGLTLALGVAGIAFADGASENTPAVDGKVKPAKLDKKKYKAVKFFTEVSTQTATPIGQQQNAEVELIHFGKNVKFKPGAADTCDATLTGTTTDQAKAACPPGSKIGSGIAEANVPLFGMVTDVVVTAFNGPGKGDLRLHAFSPSLGATLTQVVEARIVKSNAGAKYRQALSVPDAPDLAGDEGMLTKFNATISKKSHVVTARCKAKKFLWQRQVTYDDGTKETAKDSQKCKRKG